MGGREKKTVEIEVQSLAIKACRALFNYLYSSSISGAQNLVTAKKRWDILLRRSHYFIPCYIYFEIDQYSTSAIGVHLEEYNSMYITLYSHRVASHHAKIVKLI